MSDTVFIIAVGLFALNLFLWGFKEASSSKEESMPLELAFQGQEAYKSGNASAAISLFERSADLGQPNALASLIWLKLILNDFDGAIQSHEEHIKKVQAEIDERDQRHNIAANLALAHWLNGTDAKIVRNMCATSVRAGNREAIFLTHIVSGKSMETSMLTTDDIQKLLTTFKGIQNQYSAIKKVDPSSIKLDSKSTFVRYARDGEKMLKELV